jgi:hypothetical protein
LNSTAAIAIGPWRRARREYRHAAAQCSRLLFVGYLPPGTHIEIRCPACGRVHVIDVAGGDKWSDESTDGPPAVDTEQ